MFTRVLIPLDGSKFAEKVLVYLPRLVSLADTQLVLVGVLETARYASSGYAALGTLAVIRRQYESYFQDLCAALQAAGYQVAPTIVEGDAAVEILKTGQNTGADLIAMTTHGRSGAARWGLGSVANEVICGASCPVLVVRKCLKDKRDALQMFRPLADQVSCAIQERVERARIICRVLTHSRRM